MPTAKTFLDISKSNIDYSDIKKFNPYHDRLGRFTSGGSATSFTYKPGVSTAHSKAIEREKEKSCSEKGFKGTLYHGSPNKDIKEFDMKRAGQNTSSGEKLLFFTDSKKMADDFSYERLEGSSTFFQRRGKKGRVYEVDVEMKNPLDLRNLSDKDVDNVLKLDSNGILTKEAVKQYANSNHQLLKAGLNLTSDSLKELGYDGLIANTGKAGHNSLEYAVVDSKQAKIRKSDDMALSFSELMKFNPYHDAKGRFTSGSGGNYASFTYSPGKSKAHDNAIAREKDRKDDISSSKPYELSESNKEYLRSYTSGNYKDCCEISQIIEQSWNVQSGSYDAHEIEQTKQIMKAIDSQPVTDSELVRIEAGDVDLKSGDTFTWGIRSTSRDTEFSEKVLNQEDEGLENKLYSTHDDRYFGMTEYRIVGEKKALDISGYSEYDQKESLIKGKFKVLSVDKSEFKPPESKTFEQAAKDNPSLKDRYEEFTSKKGNSMVRDNETGITYKKDKFFERMVYHNGNMIPKEEYEDYVDSARRAYKRKTVVKVEQVL